MRTFSLPIALAAGIVLAAPLLSQAIDPHQPLNDGSAARSASGLPGSVEKSHDPGTRRLNVGVEADLAAQQLATGQAQAEYAADVTAFDQAVAARTGAIARSATDYDKQKQAYARAMAAWRAQVAVCKTGDRTACSESAPKIADYL